MNRLATRQGFETFVACLLYMGAMCPKCHFGTRSTSKNWARCKRCGARVARRKLPDPRGRSLGGQQKTESDKVKL